MESQPESASNEVNGKDVESSFYKMLASMQDDADKMLLDIKRDTFDASSGPQIGLTSEGHVAILMVVSQGTAKMVYDAFEGVVDHDCEAGKDAIMAYTTYTYTLLRSILTRLDCAVQETKFFVHENKSEGK